MLFKTSFSFIESLFHGVSAASSMQNVKYLPKFLQPSNPVPDSRNPDSPKLFQCRLHDVRQSDNSILHRWLFQSHLSIPIQKSTSCTDIEHFHFFFLCLFQDTTDSDHVGFSQVNNIDKVTDTRTVRCIIIITKHT